jgi:hypothetical protein
MLNRRVVRIAAMLSCLAVALVAPLLIIETYGSTGRAGAWADAILDSPIGWLIKLPFGLVMILGRLGVPWLVDPGLCSWGFCEPTWAGMLLALLLMCAALWVLAWLYCLCFPGRSDADSV